MVLIGSSLNGPLFDTTVTGLIYLHSQQQLSCQALERCSEIQGFPFQISGEPQHYPNYVRSYVDKIVPHSWTERKCFTEHPPHSPDPTAL